MDNSNLIFLKNDEIKTIKFNFHVIQNPNGPGNFEDNQETQDFFNKFMDYLNNQHMSSVSSPSHPVPEVCSTDCHIPDTRFRFELKDIHFTEDERWDWGINPPLGQDHVYNDDNMYNNEETEFNYFLVMGDGPPGKAAPPSYSDMGKRQYAIGQ